MNWWRDFHRNSLQQFSINLGKFHSIGQSHFFEPNRCLLLWWWRNSDFEAARRNYIYRGKQAIEIETPRVKVLVTFGGFYTNDVKQNRKKINRQGHFILGGTLIYQRWIICNVHVVVFRLFSFYVCWSRCIRHTVLKYSNRRTFSHTQYITISPSATNCWWKYYPVPCCSVHSSVIDRTK